MWRQKIDNARLNKAYWESLTKELKHKVHKLEDERDLSRTWIHVDMDMFYAAVAILDNPSLKDKPMAVGDKNM